MNSRIQDHSCLTANRSVQSPLTGRRAWLRLMRYCRQATANLTVPVGLSIALALASPASAQQRYERVNLVSDIDGVALRTDPNLVTVADHPPVSRLRYQESIPYRVLLISDSVRPHGLCLEPRGFSTTS